MVPLAETNKVWLGRSIAELVAAWGPPVQSFKADDGGSIHSWSMVIVKRRRSEECRRSVRVDQDGVIERWLYDTCPRPQPRQGTDVPLDAPTAKGSAAEQGRSNGPVK